MDITSSTANVPAKDTFEEPALPLPPTVILSIANGELCGLRSL
jgi:hypothetical protein